MSVVEGEVDTYITANPASSGATIKANLSPIRKNHEVKHAIASLLQKGTITITTPDTSTPFNSWELNTYTS